MSPRKTPKTPAKPIFILIAIVAVLYIIYRIAVPHGAPQNTPQGMEGGAAPVSVAEVIQREVQEWQEFSGRLVAVDKVDIRPRVSGEIKSVHFQDSALVAKGDLLFVIDPKPYDAELNRAEAALASAQAQVTLANSELARAKRLYDDKAIPTREYDERKNSANVARANVESARASVETAKINLAYTRITAPIAGKVGRTEITLGNLVEAGPNAPVLTTIVSDNPIYADFEVDEDTYLRFAQSLNASTATLPATEPQIVDTTTQPLQESNPAAQPSVPVILSVGNEKQVTYNGFVQSFDNSLNVSSGTIRARAVFDNPDGKLVPGLFARIKLGNAQKKTAVLITDRAISTDQDKKFVYVIGADNIATYRPITLGGLSDGMRIVTSGLNAGEKIVVNGLQRVRPSTPITPEIVPMEESNAPPIPTPADIAQ